MSVVCDQFVARATEDTFVKMLANVLTRVVRENETNRGVVTRFHSMNAPPISISDYIARIARHVRCSNECFVLTLVYIDRIMKLHKDFSVSVLNVHRLVITAVMLAAKFSDDVYYSNRFYAQVGGVKVMEINLLEAQFLMLINYQLYVSAADYEACRMGVERANLLGVIPRPVWSPLAALFPGGKSCNGQVRKLGYATFRSNSTTFVDSVDSRSSSFLSGTYADSPESCATHHDCDISYLNYYQDTRMGYLESMAVHLNTLMGGQPDLFYNHQASARQTVFGGWGHFADSETGLKSSDYGSVGGVMVDHLYDAVAFDTGGGGIDECEAFVNALEAPYREGVKRKCSIKADGWNCEDDRPFCRARAFVHCNKIRGAAR